MPDHYAHAGERQQARTAYGTVAQSDRIHKSLIAVAIRLRPRLAIAAALLPLALEAQPVLPGTNTVPPCACCQASFAGACVNIASISIAPANVNLCSTNPVTFTATTTPAGGAVNWTVVPASADPNFGGCANSRTLNVAANFTGTATIHAACGALSASAVVTVDCCHASANGICTAVTALCISSTNTTTCAGSPVAFTATTSPAGARVNWSVTPAMADTNFIGCATAKTFVPAAGFLGPALISAACGNVTTSAVVVVTQPPDCVAPVSGLISWWQAEGNGDDAMDANAAQLLNGVNFASGKVGQAFDLDGTDDRIVVSNSPSVNFAAGQSFSIEGWIRPLPNTTAYNLMTIVDKRYAPDTSVCQGYEFVLQGGRILFHLSDSISNNGTTFGPAGPDLRDSAFHHVAVTVERSSHSGGLMYVDGQVVMQFDPTSEPGDLSTSEPLRIGNHATASLNIFFKGQIDELALYNRALSTNEIVAIYSACSSGKCHACGCCQAIVNWTCTNVTAISITPTNTTKCPGSPVAFTATTTPAGGSVNWSVVPAGADPDFTGCATAKTFTPAPGFLGPATIIAQCGAAIASAVLVVTPPPPCVAGISGLVSWWRAEGSASDSSGTNNAQLLNGAGFNTGRVGEAFDLDGVDDRIVVSDSPSLNFGPGQNFSIEGWIRPLPNTTDYDLMTIVDKRYAPTDGSCQGYEFVLAGGRVMFHLSDSTLDNGTSFGEAGPDLRDGDFHHVAVTVERLLPTGGHLYVDGQPVLEFNPATQPGDLTTGEPLRIGNHATASHNIFFKGQIDELALYNRALSPSDVQSIYYACESGKCGGLCCIAVAAMSINPTNAAICSGDSVTFTATTVPTGSRVNWRVDPPTADPGFAGCAATDTFHPAAGFSGVATIYATCGIRTNTAVVTVNLPPWITSQPSDQTVIQGSNVTFSVAATGSAPVTYQWRFNGTDMTGQTDATLILNNVQGSQSGTYAVQVTHACGSTASSNAVLTVQVPPFIIVQPTGTNVPTGSDVTFTVAAGGTAPLAYQWMFNETNIIDGATQSSYTVTNVQPEVCGDYSVVVSNFLGSTNSQTAVLIDPTPAYVVLSGTLPDLTLKGDTTYYVNPSVSVSGVTRIEGGAVVKFAPGARLSINGPVVCQTRPFSPAVFTSRDDDSVGKKISMSTGAPSPGSAGNPAIDVNTTNDVLSNIRISYAQIAIKYEPGTASHTLNHAQIVHCGTGISADGTSGANTFYLGNLLMFDLSTAFASAANNFAGTAEHLTLHQCGTLASPSSAGLTFRNSLLVGVQSNDGRATTDHTPVLASDAGVFQTVGAGSHYLAAGSPYRHAGTTLMNQTLANDLKQKTTFPPTVVTSDITTSTTLAPRAQRDTDALDLGYHYTPLDYCLNAVSVTDVLLLTNGVALGTYGASPGAGMFISGPGKLVSQGSATSLNYIVRYNSVQEQSTSTWSASSAGSAVRIESPSNNQCRFTAWSSAGGIGTHLDTSGSSGTTSLKDCRFFGGKLIVDDSFANITNCLFERTYVSLDDRASDQQWYFYNNLFHGGRFYYRIRADNPLALAYDNLFDGTSVSQGDRGADFTGSDYNGYVVNKSRLKPNGTNDKILANTPVYDVGPLGNTYYYPTSDGLLSTLINAGSRSASAAGLYHFTTRTDQTKEGSSQVDIGYHYVALGGNGEPVDTDGDGIADYLEDPNGNGTTDAGETSYARPAITLSASALNYTEKQQPAPKLESTASVWADSPDLNGGKLTVEISANAALEDHLGIQSDGTGSGQISVNASTGTISYGPNAIGVYSGGSQISPLVIRFTSASATIAAVTALLENLTFYSTSENPGVLSRTVRLTVTDGRGGTSLPVTKTVNVTAINDPPVITLSHVSPTYSQNAPAILIDQFASVFDRDSANFNGGTFTATIVQNGNSADRLEVHHGGAEPRQIGLIYGAQKQVTYEGKVVGTATGGAGGSALTVAFNSAGGQPVPMLAVDALIKAVTFSSSSTVYSPRTVRFQVTDGSGGASVVPNDKTIAYSQSPCSGAGFFDVMMLIDHNPSSPLADTKTAAKAFVAALNLEGTHPNNDRVGAIKFTTTATEIQQLTSVETGVDTAIDSISPGGGGTYLAPAIALAHDRLKAEAEPGVVRAPVVVLVTDGRPTKKDSPKLFADAAKADGIRLIMIGLGNANATLLTELASVNTATGGKDYYYAPTSADLGAIYSRIAASLCRNVSTPPTVSFAQDFCGVMPSVGSPATVSLSATANNVSALSWSLVWRPNFAEVSFAAPASASTSATFSQPGIYVIRLTGQGGYQTATADVPVFVFPADPNPLPLVDAGLSQWTNLNATVMLKGGGKAATCGAPSFQWTATSTRPPGTTISFASPTSPTTTASGFTIPGEYVLQLTVCDSGSPVCDGTNPRAVCDTVKITVCDQQESPMDVALLFDISQSMLNDMPLARSAASTFVELLNLSVHQVALVPFHDFAAIWQPLTHDRELLKRSISTLQARLQGYTEIVPAIQLAQTHLLGPDHNPAASPTIVILSDGDWTDAGQNPDAVRQTINTAKMAGVRVITIGLGAADDPQVPDEPADWLKEAASSDADCHLISSVNDLRDAYASIAESSCLIRNRRPVVYAGPDRVTDLTRPVQLSAAVYDEDPGSLTYAWEDVTDPPVGTVTFVPGNSALSPTAIFSAVGTYRLRLIASEPANSYGLKGTNYVTIGNGRGSPPVARLDTYVLPANPQDFPPEPHDLDVLSNDVDPDGDPIRIVEVSRAPATAQNGKLEIINGGTAIRYTPSPEFNGLDTFTYTASDGRNGTAFGTVNAYVLPVNHPPKASDDLFTILKGSGPTVLDLLANDTDADRRDVVFSDKALLRIVSFTQPPSGGTLSLLDDGQLNNTISYTPPSSTWTGTAGFDYTITDPMGAQSSAHVTINVVDSFVNQSPVISPMPNQTVASVYPSSSVVFLQGAVKDDGLTSGGIPGLVSYQWTVLDQPSGSTVEWAGGPQAQSPVALLTGDGTYHFRFTVDDGEFQPYSDVYVYVVVNNVVAIVDNLSQGSIVSDGFFTVQGAAEDDPALPGPANFSYTLKVYQSDPNSPVIVLPASTSPHPRGSGLPELGTFDFTKLKNGPYTLRLEVTHGTADTTKTVDVPFILNTPLKLGRFTFGQQDVTIPVGGLPLTVVRSYDSYNISSTPGDFGFGWTYALSEMDAEIDEVRQPFADDEGESASIRTGGGRDVTLTMPNGERVTFLFNLRQGLGYYYAEWVAPPAIFARLTPIGDNRLSVVGVTAWQAGGFDTPFESFDFPGFVLTTPDGTQYELRRDPLGAHFFIGQPGIDDGSYVNAYGQIKLRTITRPNLEKIVFTDDRIDHYDTASFTTPTHSLFFKRENATYPNLITSIVDPNSTNSLDPLIKYEYTGGDLTKVYRLVVKRGDGGPTYETTSYGYGDGTAAPLHYITGIQDPRGVQAATTTYYASPPDPPELAGRIKAITDAKQRPTTFTYDLTPQNGRRSQTTTDYLGDSTTQWFDSRGNVVETVDPYQNSTSRTFDNNGNVTSELRPLNGYTEYEHDPSGNLTAEKRKFLAPPAPSLVTKNYYNQLSQVTAITDPKTYAGDPNAASTLIDYDSAGNILTNTDALGNKTIYSYFATDPNIGRLDTVTDAMNNTTSYGYDSSGNVSSQIVRSNGTLVLTTTTYTYDANNNRISETLARTLPGGGVEYLTTSNRYDPQNRLIETIDPLGSSTKTIYNNSCQCSYGGKPSTTIDKLGRQTSFLYDPTGDLIKTTYPDGTFSWRATYTDSDPGLDNGANHRADVVEDPHFSNETNVKGTRTVYDRLGRVMRTDRIHQMLITSSVDPQTGVTSTSVSGPNDPNPGFSIISDSSTVTDYDEAGRVKTVTDARGNYTAYDYDQVSRRTDVYRLLETGTPDITEHTHFDYDENGNQIHTERQDAQGLQIPASVVDYGYDSLNRRVSVTYPAVAGVHNEQQQIFNRRTTGYDPLGRAVQETDQAGVKTQFQYDPLGRLIAVTNATGLPDQTITRYAYDEAGNLRQQTDAENRVTSFEYDELGRRTKRTLPGNQVEYFTYDAAGSQLTHKDFNGRITTFVYDSMNRLTNKVADAAFGSYWVKYKYHPFGSLSNVLDSAGRSVTNLYDARNRLDKKISPEGVLQYTYDGNNNVLTVQSFSDIACTVPHAGGISLQYGRDKLNRLEMVRDVTAGNLDTIYHYNDLDLLDTCTYPSSSGVKHTYGYNEANWLSSVTISAIPSTAFSYSFDTASGPVYPNLYPGRTGARMAEKVNGTIRASYSYDPLYRLTQENISSGSPSGTIIYDSIAGYNNDPSGFDKVGNRRSRASTVMGVGPVTVQNFDRNDRLDPDTNPDNANPNYDANGNTLGDPSYTGTFSYDFENRLIGRNGSPAVSCAYDHKGNRISKTVGGTPTYFLVDEQNPTGYPQVVEELSVIGPNPTVTKTYTYGLRLISQRIPGGAVQYYGHDGHGSVRLLTDSAGTVRNTYTYDAFGIKIASSEPIENRYLYAGEQWDPDLGLYYNRARYYSPDKGRFWTMDIFEGSKEDPLSLNKYMYCHADPVIRADPSGKADYTLLSVLAGTAIGATIAVTRTAVVSKGEARARDYVKNGFVGAVAGAVGGFVFPIILSAGVAGKVIAIGFAGTAGFWTIGDDVQKGDKRALVFDSIVTAAAITAPALIRDEAPIQTYRATHEEAAADLGRFLAQNGRRIRGKDVYVRVPNYKVGREYDLIVEDPNTGLVGAIEVKSTLDEFNNSAGRQADADTYVNRFGGTAFGKRAEQAGIDGTRIDFAIRIYWRVD